MKSVLPPLDYFGHLYLAKLAKQDPAQKKTLDQNGSLGSKAAAVSAQANLKYREALQGLKSQSPEPSDPAKKARWLQHLKAQAKVQAVQVTLAA